MLLYHVFPDIMQWKGHFTFFKSFMTSVSSQENIGKPKLRDAVWNVWPVLFKNTWGHEKQGITEKLSQFGED